MINIEVNQDQLKELYLLKIDERLEELDESIYFMDSKQLQKVVNMGWNSIVTHLLSDPEFPAIRLGHKWLFNRKEVFAYLDKFYEAVRDNGGDIQKYVKK